MAPTHATVTCPDCDFQEGFEKLQLARECVERHRQETGHDPVWELEPLAEGVERAGAAAGWCGCENPSSEQ